MSKRTMRSVIAVMGGLVIACAPRVHSSSASAPVALPPLPPPDSPVVAEAPFDPEAVHVTDWRRFPFVEPPMERKPPKEPVLGRWDLDECLPEVGARDVIDVRIRFGPTGRVVDVRAERRTALPGESLECLRARLSSVRVPGFAGRDATLHLAGWGPGHMTL